MSNVVWKNIRYINAFSKYKNVILFEKINSYHSLSSRLSNLPYPPKLIDHIFGTVAMGIHKPHMSDKLQT